MFTATYKNKRDTGMRCVHVYKDGKEFAHHEFRSATIAKSYARMYDPDFRRI